jgi:hypothetical protein
MANNLESEEIFLNELKKGYSYQLVVGEYLRDRGFNVEVDELKIRGDVSEINNYTDGGDIKIHLSRRTIIVEVKSRNVKFESVGGFPYDTIFVDRVNTWKRKEKDKPHAIIIISQINNNMFVIPVSSEPNWIIESRKDTVRNYVREYYLVKKEHIKSMDEFVEWLNVRNGR